MYKKNIDEIEARQWSGGTTRELLIGPEGSNYSKGVFGFRISSATVELDTSTFTLLEGVKRTILSLDGVLTLKHSNDEPVILKPFECYHFLGDKTTESFGKVTDFNIMTKAPYDQKVSIISDGVDQKGLLYLFIGQASFYCKINDMDYSFRYGDFIIVNEDDHISANPSDCVIAIDILKKEVL